MVRCVLTRDDVVEVDGQRGVENEVNEEHEDEDVDGDLTHGQPVKRHAPVGDVQVDALKQTQGCTSCKHCLLTALSDFFACIVKFFLYKMNILIIYLPTLPIYCICLL